MLIDPEVVIRQAPPGTMLWARIDAGHGWEVALMVREETQHIRALGSHPRIEWRVAAMEEQGVLLVPILLRLARNPREPDVYETWLNAHAHGGLEALAALEQQTRVPIILYGDRGRERVLGMPNGLRDMFADLLSRVAALPAWGMAEFDRARERIYARYPTVEALWRALEPGNK